MLMENLNKNSKEYQKELETLVRYLDILKADKKIRAKFLSNLRYMHTGENKS